MDVVLYMRYSSSNQTEQSIEGQNHINTDFCNREGYNIVGRYIDRATSAFKDTDKRSEFQKMIKDSEKGLFQGVVVYKLDRFARNRYDSATYKARLKKNGVRVISATENISDNPEGVILEAVLEGMAEFYSKELSQKVTRGMNESAIKRQSVGGITPLGYKIVGKKLVIDPATAPIVKEAFQLYAEGTPIIEICNQFNNKGYRTTKGAEFNKNSFRAMFKNERYLGVYKYRDIRDENGIPAIIDKETFEKVQRRLSLNSKAPAMGKATVDYLLTQKLFCGHCGANMVGECGRGKGGKTYHYYTCANRKKHNSCDKKPIAKDVIERAVVQDTMQLLTPEIIEEIASIAVKTAEEEAMHNTILPALKAQKEEIEQGIHNLVKMVEKGMVSDAISSRLVELENEKRAVETRLIKASEDVVVLDKEQVIWWLGQFTHGTIEDPEFRRHIIDLLVNSVTIWDDPDGWKITIVYNLTGENKKTLKCSDLSGNPLPIEYNPNTMMVFGLSLFTQQKALSWTTRHSTP